MKKAGMRPGDGGSAPCLQEARVAPDGSDPEGILLTLMGTGMDRTAALVDLYATGDAACRSHATEGFIQELRERVEKTKGGWEWRTLRDDTARMSAEHGVTKASGWIQDLFQTSPELARDVLRGCSDLKVKGTLYLNHPLIQDLPEGLECESLWIVGTMVRHLPESLRVKNDLCMRKNEDWDGILPEGLECLYVRADPLTNSGISPDTWRDPAYWAEQAEMQEASIREDLDRLERMRSLAALAGRLKDRR